MDTGTLAIDTKPAAPIERVIVARGVRAFGDGYVSLLLPVYLLERGFGAWEVGVLATATLLGSGLLALAVGMHAHRFAQRSLLVAASALMCATGLAFASLGDFWPLLLVAVAGTLNPSSGDVSVFLPLEHTVLSGNAPDARRTSVFARYALTGSLLAAFGSLAAGIPMLLNDRWGIDRLAAIQAMFVLYAALGAVTALIYRGLPAAEPHAQARARPSLGPSKRRIYALAALFSLDAFGGGLVVQSLLALWLFQRFELSLATAGTIFFWTGVLSAFSYLVAVRIARRIGLVNTMVFTHIPANVCLVLIPFVPDLAWAMALLFARAALSQMDVPTRSSYVMAIVTPPERPAAASITSVPRSLASAASPMLAGWMLTVSPFGWPLVAAGALKIAYDLLLLFMFRHVRPPEEGDKP
ncbi:MAG TPA: MFS transporter [Usitatibacter sp.]|nr:MFS transporter [Usitatibacter sp.]